MSMQHGMIRSVCMYLHLPNMWKTLALKNVIIEVNVIPNNSFYKNKNSPGSFTKYIHANLSQIICAPGNRFYKITTSNILKEITNIQLLISCHIEPLYKLNIEAYFILHWNWAAIILTDSELSFSAEVYTYPHWSHDCKILKRSYSLHLFARQNTETKTVSQLQHITIVQNAQ